MEPTGLSMKQKRWITLFLGGLLGLFLGGLAVLYLFPGFVLSLAVGADRTAAGLEERMVQVAEHRIQYLSGGSGDTLLLLHGFAANKDNWTRVAAYLTPHFRVIAPDLPGLARAAGTPKPAMRSPTRSSGCTPLPAPWVWPGFILAAIQWAAG